MIFRVDFKVHSSFITNPIWLDVQANLPETSPFLSTQMYFLSNIFLDFLVYLGCITLMDYSKSAWGSSTSNFRHGKINFFGILGQPSSHLCFNPIHDNYATSWEKMRVLELFSAGNLGKKRFKFVVKNILRFVCIVFMLLHYLYYTFTTFTAMQFFCKYKSELVVSWDTKSLSWVG